MHQLQLTLTPRPAPFARKSPTSRAAAKRAEAKAPSYRAHILGFMVAKGTQGATNDEIAEALDIAIQAVCPRMHELRADGLVIESAQTRITRSGRQARVWLHWDQPA